MGLLKQAIGLKTVLSAGVRAGRAGASPERLNQYLSKVEKWLPGAGTRIAAAAATPINVNLDHKGIHAVSAAVRKLRPSLDAPTVAVGRADGMGLAAGYNPHFDRVRAPRNWAQWLHEHGHSLDPALTTPTRLLANTESLRTKWRDELVANRNAGWLVSQLPTVRATAGHTSAPTRQQYLRETAPWLDTYRYSILKDGLSSGAKPGLPARAQPGHKSLTRSMGSQKPTLSSIDDGLPAWLQRFKQYVVDPARQAQKSAGLLFWKAADYAPDMSKQPQHMPAVRGPVGAPPKPLNNGQRYGTGGISPEQVFRGQAPQMADVYSGAQQPLRGSAPKMSDAYAGAQLGSPTAQSGQGLSRYGKGIADTAGLAMQSGLQQSGYWSPEVANSWAHIMGQKKPTKPPTLNVASAANHPGLLATGANQLNRFTRGAQGLIGAGTGLVGAGAGWAGEKAFGRGGFFSGLKSDSWDSAGKGMRQFAGNTVGAGADIKRYGDSLFPEWSNYHANWGDKPGSGAMDQVERWVSSGSPTGQVNPLYNKHYATHDLLSRHVNLRDGANRANAGNPYLNQRPVANRDNLKLPAPDYADARRYYDATSPTGERERPVHPFYAHPGVGQGQAYNQYNEVPALQDQLRSRLIRDQHAVWANPDVGVVGLALPTPGGGKAKLVSRVLPWLSAFTGSDAYNYR